MGKTSLFKLVKVESVPEEKRDIYKLTIKKIDTGNKFVKYLNSNYSNIRKYCKQNNISLVKYEDAYNYNDIRTEDYIDLIGVIDKYITEDIYQYKRMSID